MTEETTKEFHYLFLEGEVVRGFGRGGKQLGFPTANLNPAAYRDHLTDTDVEGVYYGWSLLMKPEEEIQPMVMSIGWNPHFNNKEKSVEVHILKKYHSDFYGANLCILVAGFIRPMCKFNGLTELSDAIRMDIARACVLLEAPKAQSLKSTLHYLRGDKVAYLSPNPL